MKYSYSIILLFVCSCIQNTKEIKIDTHQIIEKIEKVKEIISIEKLMLLSKEEAIHTFGSFTSIEKFTLNDAVGEFRNNITNKYIEDERQQESILIEEVTWEKDKETWITVWYEIQQKKSIPKAVYVWNKGTEF